MPQFIPFAGTVGSAMGAGAATSTAAMGTGAMTMAAVGTTAYSVQQGMAASAAAKAAAADASARSNKAAKALKDAQDAASSQALAAVNERRKRMNASQTIFTNPLGLGEVASLSKKLLGQ